MASTNQSPEYLRAHGKFLSAETDKEKLEALEEMIRTAPKHKSSENLLANLKTRYKKLKAKIEKTSKKGKSSKQGIKKHEMQAVIVGKTNSGKSFLLSVLTNAHPKISAYNNETKFPQIGMLNYGGTQIQIIEIPAVESEFYDKGVVNMADVIIILITEIKEINEIAKHLEKACGKKIIVFNLKENLDKRKLEATLKSKKFDSVIVNLKTEENMEKLKEKIFQSFDKIRVYTKEPHKEKTQKPIVLNSDAVVKDVAEKIFHGLSSQIKETRVTGPSSKFPNQVVSLNHKLKDLDTIEFRVK